MDPLALPLPATRPAASNETRLDEALAEYMERSDLGENVDRAEFLEKYSDIRGELSAFFHVANQLAEVQLGQILEGRKPKSLAESLAAAAPVAAPSATVPVAIPVAVTSPPVTPAIAVPVTASPLGSASLPVGQRVASALPIAVPVQAAAPLDEPEVAIQEPQAEQLQGEEPNPSKLGLWFSRQFRTAQPVLLSAVLHVVALLVLASISLSLPVLQEIVPILVQQNNTDDSPAIEPMVKIDLPQSELESAEAVQTVAMSDSVDISSLNDAPSSIRADLSEVGSQHTMSLETLVRSPGRGDQLGKAGMGKVKFFGQSSSGQKFAFVIDNSGSMTKGRFETALYELQSAVEQMQPTQMFYVIFFSDTAYSLFHPEPAYGFIPATSANKQKLAVWLKTVETCLRTEGLEAMQKAISLRPDVIYLLGDGAFTDKTGRYLAELPSGPPIHVLGMEVSPKHADSFKEIATKFKGTYKDVGIRPEMAGVAKEHPRPFNKKKGSVWGLKLPQ